MTTGMLWLDATVSVLPSIVMLAFSPSLPPSLSLSLSLSPSLPPSLSLSPCLFSLPLIFPLPLSFLYQHSSYKHLQFSMLPIHAYLSTGVCEVDFCKLCN